MLCKELGVSTWADNLREAQRELMALIAEYLEMLEDQGARGEIFDRFGVKIHALPRASRDVTCAVTATSPSTFTIPTIIPLECTAR